MEDNSNKRIVKNTVFLYIRMLIVMFVSIFTSRVILNSLGSSDYGIYNVVGGVVTMMGFLNGALSAATSRFLTFELGRNNIEELKKTFSASLNLHILVGLLVIIVGESAGVWYLYNMMVMPEERLYAAFWVLQFSIITTFFSFTQVPYSASLISHERMGIYAYVGLYEALSKLLIAYLITAAPFDRLIWYALLLMLNNVGIQLFYRYYTHERFIECRFHLVRDMGLYKKIMGYSGWDLFGNIAVICQNQGINLLLNFFFGPVVNAARAIALQIQTAITQFTNNFLVAVRPQVVKKFAEEDYEAMYKLTFYSTKYAFYMMLAFVLPICFEIDYILGIWLGDEIPEGTSTFAIIILITALIQTWSSARNMAYHAIGRIKTGNVVGGSIMIASLPISYFALKMGAPAYSVFFIILITNIFVQINGTYLIHKYVHFDLPKVLLKFYMPCIIVGLLSMITPYCVVNMMNDGFIRFITLLLSSEFVLAIIILSVGLSSSERSKGLIIIKKKYNDRFKK